MARGWPRGSRWGMSDDDDGSEEKRPLTRLPPSPPSPGWQPTRRRGRGRPPAWQGGRQDDHAQAPKQAWSLWLLLLGRVLEGVSGRPRGRQGAINRTASSIETWPLSRLVVKRLRMLRSALSTKAPEGPRVLHPGGQQLLRPGHGVAPRPDFTARVYPNPFNPSTRITLDLPRAGDAQVEIYDVKGRLIRRLHDGRLNAGSHFFDWDGTGSGGTVVASGTYFARITAARGAKAIKLTFLK